MRGQLDWVIAPQRKVPNTSLITSLVAEIGRVETANVAGIGPNIRHSENFKHSSRLDGGGTDITTLRLIRGRDLNSRIVGTRLAKGPTEKGSPHEPYLLSGRGDSWSLIRQYRGNVGEIYKSREPN